MNVKLVIRHVIAVQLLVIIIVLNVRLDFIKLIKVTAHFAIKLVITVQVQDLIIVIIAQMVIKQGQLIPVRKSAKMMIITMKY